MKERELLAEHIIAATCVFQIPFASYYKKNPHEHKNPTSISVVTAGGHTVKSLVIQSYIPIMM